MISIPRFIATLLLISYLKTPNFSNESRTQTQFAIQESEKDSAYALDLLHENVFLHDEKSGAQSAALVTEHKAPGDVVLQRNFRQGNIKEIGKDVEQSVDDRHRRKKSGKNEMGNFIVTFNRDAKRKFPLKSVDLEIVSLTSSVEKIAGASSCRASKSLSMTKNNLQMKTISKKPSAKHRPVSFRNNEEHVTRPTLDRTQTQVCAEAWRSVTWPSQRRQHSHCVTARRERGFWHTLSCNLMGKLTGAACDEPKTCEKKKLAITGRWKLQGENFKSLNLPISDVSITKLTLSTWEAVRKSSSRHPSTSVPTNSAMASNSKTRRHYLLFQADVSLEVREFNLSCSTPVDPVPFGEDPKMENSDVTAAGEREKLQEHPSTSRHLCSSPTRLINSHGDGVSSEGVEQRVERRRRSIESLKTSQFGEHVQNLVEPSPLELGDEDPSQLGTRIQEWAPWLVIVAVLVLVFMTSLRKAARRLPFDSFQGIQGIQTPSQSAPQHTHQAIRPNENAPNRLEASQNSQASGKKGNDSSQRTASVQAEPKQLDQALSNILPASGSDTRAQSLPDKGRFGGVRKNCGVGQKRLIEPIQPANTSLRPPSFPYEKMELAHSPQCTGGRSSERLMDRFSGARKPAQVRSLPHVEPMDTEESQFIPDNIRDQAANERRLQAPTRIRIEFNGTHVEQMDVEVAVPKANTGAIRQGLVTPSEQKNTKTRQFHQSRYKGRQSSKRSGISK